MPSKSQIVRWAVNVSHWKPPVQELSLACCCIQPEEKERLVKFHFREDFNSSLAGRLLMRKFANLVTGTGYKDVLFERDDRGKPLLKNPPEKMNVDFSVSHQGSYCVLAGVAQAAVSEDAEVTKIGVDVMKIEYTGGKPLEEFFRLMNRNFSQNEWQIIRSHAQESERLKAFMRNWCLKESYVKNIGVGITINLQEVGFEPATNLGLGDILTDTTLKLKETDMKDWKFEEQMLDSEHCVAIAVKNPPPNYLAEPFEIYSMEDLLRDAVPLLEPDDSYVRKVLCKEFKNK